MPKPENLMVNRILKLISQDTMTKAIKLHGSIYQEEGTPDILIVKTATNGRVFTLMIEAKLPDEFPTPIQEYRLREWGLAGAITASVHTMEGFCRLYGQVERGELKPGYTGGWW